MNFGEVSDNFRKFFPKGLIKQGGYSSVANSDWIRFADLQMTKQETPINDAWVTFMKYSVLVFDHDNKNYYICVDMG